MGSAGKAIFPTRLQRCLIALTPVAHVLLLLRDYSLWSCVVADPLAPFQLLPKPHCQTTCVTTLWESPPELCSLVYRDVHPMWDLSKLWPSLPCSRIIPLPLRPPQLQKWPGVRFSCCRFKNVVCCRNDQKISIEKCGFIWIVLTIFLFFGTTFFFSNGCFKSKPHFWFQGSHSKKISFFKMLIQNKKYLFNVQLLHFDWKSWNFPV